jgi:hypothetical protein
MTRMTPIEELAHRESAGIAVSLFWSREGNALSVVVRDNRTGEEFSLTAGAEEAMDVFQHPFAYAATRGVASSLSSSSERLAA